MNDLTSSWEYPFVKKIEALEKRIEELEEGLREISQLYDKCVSIYGSPATALYVACEKAGELLSEGGADE